MLDRKILIDDEFKLMRENGHIYNTKSKKREYKVLTSWSSSGRMMLIIIIISFLLGMIFFINI